MSQVDDYSLGNLSFPAARARLNNLFAAIRAANAGATAPTNPQPGMFWFDTSVSPAVLRQRNAGNTAWDQVSPPIPVPVSQGGTGATTAAAARTALGAPGIPVPVNQGGTGATTAAAARTALGATSIGGDLFTAASASAARAAMAAPPIPTGASGAGDFGIAFANEGTAYTLPSGGTWAYSVVVYNTNGTWNTQVVGVAAGGTTLSGTAGIKSGWRWRIT